MKINNKGFTMVELLVAMAIMGLLIIMAFPTIRAIQSNNTSTKYKEYGKAALSASKLYVDSYEEDLFDLNDNNGMKSIDLNDLVKKDLLKDISMSDSTCLNGSSVNIIKYKDDYTYCLNLVCSTGGKEVYKEISKEGKCKDLTLYKVTYSNGSTNHVVSVVQGNNHTISNLIVSTEVWGDEQSIALFHYLSRATISNLHFKDVRFEIDKNGYTPRIAGLCYECGASTLENISMEIETSFNGEIPLVYDANSIKTSDIAMICNGESVKNIMNM